MSPQETLTTRPTSAARRGVTLPAGATPVRPHAWHGNPVELRSSAQRAATVPDFPPLPAGPRAAAPDSTGDVLSPAEFDRFLVRERNLADRGTRLFSLIVLRRSTGSQGAWLRLAPAVRERLRATDLVGQLDGDRVALLLTDTETRGARVVADWVDLLVAELGLRIEPTIYVYPAPDAELPPTRTTPAAPEAARGPPRWPVAALWTELTRPMPRWKRALDVSVASLALLALAPLFAAVALAIKLDSPGPVFFQQLRAGRSGRAFAFHKFRSMFVDAEERRAGLEALNEKDGPIFKIQDDPRITRTGRWLRRWSIDELPQLWNILRGDISLVGPRSPTMNEVSEYERWQRKRLNVIGGVTCIWQVSGRSQVSFRDWMRMDMQYVRRGGLWLDLWLLARTIPAVLSGRGAC